MNEYLNIPGWDEEISQYGSSKSLLLLPPGQGCQGGGGPQKCCEKKSMGEEGRGKGYGGEKGILACKCPMCEVENQPTKAL